MAQCPPGWGPKGRVTWRSLKEGLNYTLVLRVSLKNSFRQTHAAALLPCLVRVLSGALLCLSPHAAERDSRLFKASLKMDPRTMGTYAGLNEEQCCADSKCLSSSDLKAFVLAAAAVTDCRQTSLQSELYLSYLAAKTNFPRLVLLVKRRVTMLSMQGNYSKWLVNDWRSFTKLSCLCLCPSLPAMFPFGKVLFPLIPHHHLSAAQHLCLACIFLP